MRTVAEVCGVVEADQPVGAAGAGQRGQEARGLTLVTLALVVGQKLEDLLLRGQDPLRTHPPPHRGR